MRGGGRIKLPRMVHGDGRHTTCVVVLSCKHGTCAKCLSFSNRVCRQRTKSCYDHSFRTCNRLGSKNWHVNWDTMKTNDAQGLKKHWRRMAQIHNGGVYSQNNIFYAIMNQSAFQNLKQTKLQAGGRKQKPYSNICLVV